MKITTVCFLSDAVVFDPVASPIWFQWTSWPTWPGGRAACHQHTWSEPGAIWTLSASVTSWKSTSTFTSQPGSLASCPIIKVSQRVLLPTSAPFPSHCCCFFFVFFALFNALMLVFASGPCARTNNLLFSNIFYYSLPSCLLIFSLTRDFFLFCSSCNEQHRAERCRSDRACNRVECHQAPPRQVRNASYHQDKKKQKNKYLHPPLTIIASLIHDKVVPTFLFFQSFWYHEESRAALVVCRFVRRWHH